MSRSLRIQYPGAWYHVMHRATNHSFIFNNQAHFSLFIECIIEAYLKYKIETHAYCFMNNHYHLLVRTPYGNLSDAMRHINGVFTQKYNRLLHHDGAIFRGRYKAALIEADNYLLEVSRYIHLNPIKAGICLAPEDHRWSSYNFYINKKRHPDWLFCNNILARFGKNNCHEEYRKFVLSGINEQDKSLFEKRKKVIPSMMGSDEFIYQKFKEHTTHVSKEEIPECRIIEKCFAPSAEDVVNTVSHYFNIKPGDLTRRPNRKQGNIPRKIALYLAFRTNLKNKRDITKIFEGITYRSISHICRKLELEMEAKKDTTISDEINKIKKLLLQQSDKLN